MRTNPVSKIVGQVIREYKSNLRKLKNTPGNKAAIYRILELRDEIMTPYFDLVSMGHGGEPMIRQIEIDFEKEWEEMQRKKRKKEVDADAEHA